MVCLGEFTDPEQSDSLFKFKFRTFREKCLAKYGWDLFKPTRSDDEHYFQNIRVPPLTYSMSRKVLFLISFPYENSQRFKFKRPKYL